MGDESAPEVEGGKGVDTGEPSDKVAFECVDRFFGGVGAVVVGRDELKGDAVLREETLESVGALVVALLKDGGEAAEFEVGVYFCVRLDEVCG